MLNIQLHLNEFNFRFLYIFFCFCITFIFSYLYSNILMYLLALPFLKHKLRKLQMIENDFIFTNIFEAFSSYVTISLIIAIYFTLPFAGYITFNFVLLGLYSYEKNIFATILIMTFILSIAAIWFVYNIFLPLIFKFFLNFEQLTKTTFFTLKLEQKIIDYVYLISCLFIIFVLCFQIPLILYYLLRYKFISFVFIKQNRRIFILIFFFIGCLLSPPDIYSLLLVALPLCICFESLFLVFQIKESYKICDVITIDTKIK